VATRKDEKERRRAARLEAEQREAAAARKRLVLGYGVAGLLTAAVIAGIVVVVATGGSGGSGGSGRTYAPGDSVPAAAEVGVQTTPPPWQPEYAHLAQRLQSMGLPGLNENIFHIHSLVHVYVNGKPVTVPANIGLNDSTGPFSSLHTHDTSGIIHMEADRTYPFTIGQLFAVWGVKFSDQQLGPYQTKGNQKLGVYVDGKRVGDPVNYVMREHDNIVVGYGKPGSFPTKPQGSFPVGL
jgi:hypothetical protein